MRRKAEEQRGKTKSEEQSEGQREEGRSEKEAVFRKERNLFKGGEGRGMGRVEQENTNNIPEAQKRG
jgi:hypothetical protein